MVRREPTVPLGQDPSNPYGVGMGGQYTGLGFSALKDAGIGVGGSTVTPSGDLSSLVGGNMVYMGTGAKVTGYAAAKERKQAGVAGVGDIDLRMSYEEARGLPLVWARNDPNKLKEFVNKGILNKVPGFSPDMGIMEIASAWDDMVKASIEFTKSSGSNWSPYDVMDTYRKSSGQFGTKREGDWIIDLATDERVKYVGPKSKTLTSKQVNLSSADDVKALTMQMLRELLGRNPSPEEITRFKTSINAMEQAAPEVTTTTVELAPDLATGEVEEVGRQSVTTGGVSQAAMQAAIEEEATTTPEYAKYQGGTTYFNALLQMIGGGL